jgi:ABC-type multidrug transport system fused ATPase/permease subunit
MVFEQGKIVEFDNPTVLLATPTSRFALLVAAARQSAMR